MTNSLLEEEDVSSILLRVDVSLEEMADALLVAGVLLLEGVGDALFVANGLVVVNGLVELSNGVFCQCTLILSLLFDKKVFIFSLFFCNVILIY